LLAVLTIVSCGTGIVAVVVVVAVHGGAVSPGVQSPPAGGALFAVLVIVAGGAASTIAVTVYVTELPAGNGVIVSLTAPLPLAVHVAPPLGTQVQVWLAMPVGIGSDTVVPSAALEPVFVTVTV
jgi:hypothetical protein